MKLDMSKYINIFEAFNVQNKQSFHIEKERMGKHKCVEMH